MTAREYLYIDQLAELTPWTPASIRTMIARGVFKLGVHYFKPQGRNSRPIFLWSAVREFIENGGVNRELLEGRAGLASGMLIDLDETAREIHRLLR